MCPWSVLTNTRYTRGPSRSILSNPRLFRFSIHPAAKPQGVWRPVSIRKYSMQNLDLIQGTMAPESRMESFELY